MIFRSTTSWPSSAHERLRFQSRTNFKEDFIESIRYAIQRTGTHSESGSDRSSIRSGSSGKSLRSEEHTSELQSPCNLVCRLLLEKKKQRRGWRTDRSAIARCIRHADEAFTRLYLGACALL